MLRRLLTVLSGMVVLVPGCSSSSGSGAPGSPTSADSHRGTKDAAGVTIQLGDPPGTLHFDPSGPEQMQVQIPVLVSPPDTYTVRFALVGDVRDAYLDASEVRTDDTGAASVELTAPSSPAKFRLRASTAGASAELAASADPARTTINVLPAYDGKRPITAWIATVDIGSHCDPLAPVPPPDGLLRGEAGFNQSVPVPNVPVGTRLRVTVRAGQFAGGCTDVPALAVDKLPQVSVTVTDRPMQMTSVSIPVSLGIDQGSGWVSAWSALTDKMVAAATRGAPSDANALLTDMSTLTPYLVQDAFEGERALFHWNERVSDLFAHGGSRNAITDTLRGWLQGALAPLSTGAISGTLTSPPLPLGSASLTVDTLAGTEPAASGFPPVIGLTWTSAGEDQILFGGTAWWKPSRLAAGLALARAQQQVHSADSVPAALAKRLPCADVGTLIADDAPSSLLLGCDASCMATRCEQALDAMWERAAQSAQNLVLVHVSGTGAARIDDNARPTSFVGTWVGDASLGGAETRVTGPAIGGDAPASPR